MEQIFYEENQSSSKFDKPAQILIKTHTNIQNNPSSKKQQNYQNQYTQNDKYQSMLQAKDEFASNGNNKNKYINRIKVMIKQTDLDKSQTNSTNLITKSNIKSLSEVEINPLETGDQRRQRNRLSAKMSRQRKKVYIQLLENKVNELKRENQKKMEELNSTELYLQKLMEQNQTVNNFTVGKQQILKKIQKLLQNQRDDNSSQIIAALDSLHYKNGTLGKQRKNSVYNYFKQIVNISFPALHRYVIWTASQKKHLFAQKNSEQQQEWFKQLDEKLCLSEQQKRQIHSRRNYLQQHNHILKNIMSELEDTKINIQLTSNNVENEIQKIRKILTPIQCAKFVLFIERNKYRKQLSVWNQKQVNELKSTIESKFEDFENQVQKKRKI